MRNWVAIADRLIRPSTNRKEVRHIDADVKDIISTILHADGMSQQFTERFSHILRGGGDMKTLSNIWEFVRGHIRYQKDRAGSEVVKSPGRTWADRYGDCKSMSVMVGSLLRNLGYNYFYRVAFYDPENPEQGHIYPVAVLPSGKLVVVDAVHHSFNEEVPFWKAHDYDPATGEKKKAIAISGGTTPQRTGLTVLATVGAALLIGFAINNQCQAAND